MKKIITVAPMQPVASEGECYVAVNNGRLQYDEPSCYPVLALISGYIKQGEEVEIYVLTTEEHDQCSKNYYEQEQLIHALCHKIGASCTVSRIPVPFNESPTTHLRTFKALLDRIGDGDIVYADMTYGSKCLAIVLMMSLNYAYQSCKNCTVECFIYGSKDFRQNAEKGKRIFDVTALFLMDQIVNELAKSGNKNPKRAIEAILDINESINDED